METAASRLWWKNRKGVFSRYSKTILALGESQTEEESLAHMEALLGRTDPLSEALRGKIREAELRKVLVALPYECNGFRRGYRNGKRERWMSTGLGVTVIELRRARFRQRDGERNGKAGWLRVISVEVCYWVVT
jgi:hypothetical protein